jgi:superfamily II DNA or RNA helicase
MHLYVYTTQSRPYEFKYGIFKKNNYKRIFTGQSYFGEKIIIKYLYKIHKEFDYNFYKDIDKIISIYGKNNELINMCEEYLNIKLPLLKQLKHGLINSDGGTELCKIDYLQLFDNFIMTEFYKFKLKIIKYSNEKIELLLNDIIKKQYNKKQNKKNKIICFLKNKNHFITHIKPFDYQTYLLNKIDIFKKNKINTLLWSCGLGKTFMSLFISQKINARNILICVPSIYLLNQFKQSIKNVFNFHNILYLYGDSENKKELETYLLSNKKKIILSTYHSCYKVLYYCNKNNFVFDIKIGDECHHLVGIKDENSCNFVKFHEIKSKYTLFMTATTKNSENIIDYTMSNENVFGNTFDTKSIKWAIENKKITDYKIMCIYNTSEEVNNIMEQIDFNLICSSNNKYNKKELFMAAYSALSSINKGIITHTLVYTNNINSANVVKKIIDKLLEMNIFNNINDIYNEDLSSESKLNINEEVEIFKKNKYGIISCVYIFGEGFDMPKLNGVVIGEKMTSDIRIVQSCLRPNRLEKENPTKLAHIIIPTDINNIDDKMKMVISKMANEDEDIEYKVEVMKLKTSNKKSNGLYNKKIKMKKNKDALNLLKFNLFSSGCFGRQMKIEEEYEYYKNINIEQKMNSVKEYKENKNIITNPPAYFHKIWIDWFDYLNIDTMEWIKDKDEFIKYCKQKNIKNVEEYYLKIDNKMPPEPEYFYKNFNGLVNELKPKKYRYIKY